MPTAAQTKKETAPPTLIGWQGVRFTLPPDWNMTGFSTDRDDGYLKVDSPGTMFVQVKWSDPRFKRPSNFGEWAFRKWQKSRKKTEVSSKTPDLRVILENFLKQTEKQSKKARSSFDSKIRPETTEANGERTAFNFSWSGGGQGQGKIWYCKACGRVVVAQVVGTAKDNIANVASQMLGSIGCHGENGWETWALYDLVAGIPSDFMLKSQQLMSGYLKLEFSRRGGERISVERWGLANVSLKKFTLSEWFRKTCNLGSYKLEETESAVQDHEAIRASGRIRSPFLLASALRDAIGTLRPATRYDGCCWECPETNKLYAVQVWHNVKTEGLLEEVAARCECH
jgi:hypothetical protein